MNKRIDDDEILFTTLLLMFGEPPTWPRVSTTLSDSVKFARDNKLYAIQIKNMMAELGHNPHQGLYTSYMHWWKEEWDAKQNEQECAQTAQAKSGAKIHNMLVGSRPTAR